MFKYKKNMILNLSIKYGFNKNTLEKVLRLIDVLSFINNDKDISGKLALKGGTSINLTVFNVKRLSVDIDLDYIGSLNYDEMIADRKIINNLLVEFMKSNEYIFREDNSRNRFILDSYLFNYNNLFGGMDSLKIEINYIDRIHLFDCEYRLLNLCDESLNVLTLNKFDLFASKFNALITRSTIRDVYDVYNMIDSNIFVDDERNLFHKFIIYYLLLGSNSEYNFNDFIEAAINKINNYADKIIPQYLSSTLHKNDNFYIKDAVKTVVLFIKEFLESIDENERSYINSFPNLKEGISLFIDENIESNAKKHPMIKWKIKNQNSNNS